MELELTGKCVLVTGGARGIGRAIVHAFAREGAVVCIFDRERAEGEALAAGLREGGAQVHFVAIDLCDQGAIAAGIARVLAVTGRLDVLVNNAGGNDAIGLAAPPDQFVESLRRNLVHYFACAHYALEPLQRTRGCIVNIGSKTATTGQGGTSGYAAAKGAIDALTREWATDLAAGGIRVNCVVPAEVITPLYERWLEQSPDPQLARKLLDRSVPLGGRTTTAEEIADTVVFLASARSSHTTGQIVFVDGGYVHLDRACTSETIHLKRATS